jgi:AcrR family transcriptional regulator
MNAPGAAVVKKKKVKSRRLKLTREERAKLVEQRLFDAAIQVVGREGYASASVMSITELAEVAQGTFYNYFPTRQDLLDQLLPTVGLRMLDFIGTRIRPDMTEPERESARFRAFFEFLLKTPEFFRILVEAQVYAPAGYEKHIELVSRNYQNALRRGGVGEDRFTAEELEVVTHILMGARSYLSHHYSYTDDRVHEPPEAVFTAYEKLIGSGLFR